MTPMMSRARALSPLLAHIFAQRMFLVKAEQVVNPRLFKGLLSCQAMTVQRRRAVLRTSRRTSRLQPLQCANSPPVSCPPAAISLWPCVHVAVSKSYLLRALQDIPRLLSPNFCVTDVLVTVLKQRTLSWSRQSWSR